MCIHYHYHFQIHYYLVLPVELQIEDEFPPLIDDIIKSLGNNRCRAFEEFINDVDENVLNSFVEVVTKCFKAQQLDKKDKMFTIFDFSLSVIVAMEKRIDQLRKNELRNNVGGVMVSQDADSWTSLILTFDEDMNLKSATGEDISQKSFSAYDWKIVRVIGNKLKDK